MGWRKYCVTKKTGPDGETATTESIFNEEKHGSWSQTNLKDLTECSLLFANCYCQLESEVPGIFHQSDDYLAVVSTGQTEAKIVRRRLQAKIGPGMVVKKDNFGENNLLLYFYNKEGAEELEPAEEGWHTIELSEHGIKYYVSQHKI